MIGLVMPELALASGLRLRAWRPALLSAGWLAGRQPLSAATDSEQRPLPQLELVLAAPLAVLVLVLAQQAFHNRPISRWRRDTAQGAHV
jgi:hypothetical protein